VYTNFTTSADKEYEKDYKIKL